MSAWKQDGEEGNYTFTWGGAGEPPAGIEAGKAYTSAELNAAHLAADARGRAVVEAHIVAPSPLSPEFVALMKELDGQMAQQIIKQAGEGNESCQTFVHAAKAKLEAEYKSTEGKYNTWTRTADAGPAEGMTRIAGEANEINREDFRHLVDVLLTPDDAAAVHAIQALSAFKVFHAANGQAHIVDVLLTPGDAAVAERVAKLEAETGIPLHHAAPIAVGDLVAEQRAIDEAMPPMLTPDMAAEHGLNAPEMMAYLDARKQIVEHRKIPDGALSTTIPSNMLVAELQRLGIACKLAPGDIILTDANNRKKKRILRAKFKQATENITKRLAKMGAKAITDGKGNQVGYHVPETNPQ